MPRVSIRSLMFLVAVAGPNLAAGRALYEFEPMLLAVLAPIGLAWQAAIARMLICPASGRPFWAGFVAGSSLLVASLAWGMLDPPRSASRLNPATGVTMVWVHEGSPAARAWDAYARRAQAWLWALPIGLPAPRRPDLGSMFVHGTLVLTPPVAAAGLAVGLVGQGMARSIRRRRRGAEPCTAPAVG